MSETDESKSKKILIVEDHQSLRETLSSWLEEKFATHSVTTAATGEEAVALAGRIKPDLILMDIRLPGISGIETMKEIFRRGISPEVIMITNHDEEIYRREAMNSGARSYMLKRTMWNSLPVIINELLS